MPDEPISALTKIAAPTGTPPYPTAFTNPSTGAMLEILDTTNTSMASTGTNSKIAPGDLLAGFLAAGSNVTLTETSGIVTIASSGSSLPGGASNGQVLTEVSGSPAWQTPVLQPGSSNNYATAVLSSGSYAITSSFANIGLSLTLPTAGTWLLTGTIRGLLYISASVSGGWGLIESQIYDQTNSVVVTNSTSLAFVGYPPTTSTTYIYQTAGPLGPVVYTVSGSAVLQVQAEYNLLNTTETFAEIYNDSAGCTSFTAVRIA